MPLDNGGFDDFADELLDRDNRYKRMQSLEIENEKLEQHVSDLLEALEEIVETLGDMWLLDGSLACGENTRKLIARIKGESNG